LQLNLVYNPDGLNLPPAQAGLELDYKRELKQQYGIVFNQLFTITNMPISRFGGMLLAKGLYHQYMDILRDSYRAENLETVMCRSLLSIDYEGFVYDCDFNQMLVMPLATLLFVVGTEVGGTARGTLTGILSGSGYVSYAVGAGIGGLAVAHIGYSALSFALVASTIGSSILLTFFIRTKAEDRAREYFQ